MKKMEENICALVKENVEIPEDISGATCKVMDLAGAWKNEECGYSNRCK